MSDTAGKKKALAATTGSADLIGLMNIARTKQNVPGALKRKLALSLLVIGSTATAAPPLAQV